MGMTRAQATEIINNTKTIAEIKENQTQKADDALKNVTNKKETESTDTASWWELSMQNTDDDNYDSDIDYNSISGDSSLISQTKTIQGLESQAVTNTATETKAATTKKIFSMDTQYNSTSGSRLTKFDYATGADDASRRAYFSLSGSTDAIKLLKESVKSDAALTAIAEALTQDGHKFMNFILTGISENLQEKQYLMQTVGDYYTATFGGMDPYVLAITGLLPFDTSSTQSSWFINFINAYIHLIRASKLALYRLQLKLIIPDYCPNGYICYPTNIMYNLNSSNDNLVQFSMSLIVVEQQFKKAWGITSTAIKAESTAEKVKNTELSKNTSTVGGSNTKSPKDVGDETKSKNWMETVTTEMQKAASVVSDGVSTFTQGINTVNKIAATVQTITGAVTTIKGSTSAFGSRFKLF